MCKKNNKLIKTILILILAAFLCCSCTQRKTNIIMEIENLHNGNAKFYNDNIITTVDGKLTMLDAEGNIIFKSGIAANWVNCIDKEGLIIYCNSQHVTGIAHVDNNNHITSYNNIMETDNLQIDPAIINVNGTYFATVTEIEGPVDNYSTKSKYGIYTIHLYKSENLSDWTFVRDIVSENRNLEDVELFYENNSLYILYERERTERGKSEIYIAKSTDLSGTVWEEPKFILPADCDHEPAAIFKSKEGYTVFYSCDKNNPEQSYMGAEIMYAEFDNDFNIIQKDIKVSTKTITGILLYDVKLKDDKYYFLFSKNHFSDYSLILESGYVK